jgi:predicted  nucleic acid-binding Zn-ribbon protein
MHPDLERLIRLQQLETFAETARRTIAELPERVAALDLRLASARGAVDSARQRLAANQSARRTAEKELATQQARLSRYKDQLMEVKTNKEYQAMQKEIEAAQKEVRQLEDTILERMIEADDVAAAIKEAEAGLVADQAQIEAERQRLEDEARALQAEFEKVAARRQALVSEIPASAMAIFELLIGRRGTAVVEARDGHCTACHVRLRPQVFNDLRRNDSLMQCDSCQRILYFKEDSPPTPPAE